MYISGGTLTRSFEDARLQAPNNPFVLKLLDDGLDIIELHPYTPLDACKYRKLTSNTFGDNGAANVIELLDEVPDTKSSWKVFYKSSRMETVSDLGSLPVDGNFTYQKMHDRYILVAFGSLYQNDIELYKDAVFVRSYFDSLDCYDQYRDIYDNRSDDLAAESKDCKTIMKNMAEPGRGNNT